MVWAFEEDYIVCKFYVEHEDDWKDNLDSLMKLLWEHGFRNRDKASTRMRVQNYEYNNFQLFHLLSFKQNCL